MFEGIDGLDLKNNFYRSIVNGNTLSIAEIGKPPKSSEDLDPSRSYRFNSHGFRGPELIANAELVTAGCSCTYGLGVSEDAIWPSLVSRELNITHNNIAKPGASIGWIVEKLFNYFKEFGHPKYLLCLMPDAKRFVVPADGNILTKDHIKRTLNYGEVNSQGGPGQFLYNEVAKSNSEISSIKYLKRPYNIRDIYTSEFGYYTSIRHLRALEQYCRAAGIKLIWSTWDFELSFHMKSINSDPELAFENYVDIKTFFYKKLEGSLYKDAIFTVDLANSEDIDLYLNCIENHANSVCSCYESCHEELISKYGEQDFHSGSDTLYSGWNSHPGCHLHAHYADSILKGLRSKYPLDFS